MIRTLAVGLLCGPVVDAIDRRKLVVVTSTCLALVSAVFAGKSPLERQRLVLSAIKHLINGDRAPVHAVDELLTRTP